MDVPDIDANCQDKVCACMYSEMQNEIIILDLVLVSNFHCHICAYQLPSIFTTENVHEYNMYIHVGYIATY